MPGIDHIVELGSGKRKVCMKFNQVSINGLTPLGTCSISNDTITGDFSGIDFDTDVYVYLTGTGLEKLFFISQFMNNKTKAIIKDVWENDVNFPQQDDIGFYKFTRQNRMTIDAIQELAKEMQKISCPISNITRPKTWIQPGGRHPIISMAELSTALVPLGYTAGASFGEVQSLKVFNEYDPDNVKKFGMQWEDFNEDRTDQTMDAKLKNKISDGIAKHKVMIGS
ncbi:MAG: hypothetical protein H6613_03735 [Ignavibacteriales bacterium]|nr:hypothetical protein [Ignavibacteriales bacterium]